MKNRMFCVCVCGDSREGEENKKKLWIYPEKQPSYLPIKKTPSTFCTMISLN